MSVKLQKEHIKLSEVICSRYCQTTTECDIIVPDIKPDVLKVLRISSEAVITEKTVLTDQINVCGTVRLDILYIPDGNVIGCVKSISTTHSFNHTIDAKGAKPGMTLFAEAECESSECNLVNSRKLNIRSKININVKVSNSSEIDIATQIDSEEPIKTKCEHLKINNCCCEAERDIMLRDRLDVPGSKPGLAEILKVSAKPLLEEIRLLDNKVIIKGELKITTLYCGDDENSTVQCMEHTSPFTEILEVSGITENMSGEADYCVKDINYEICRDSDGDKRILSTEVTVCVCIRATEIIECEAICDAYGIKHEIKTEMSEYNIEQLIDTARAKINEKEQIPIPDYLPEIQQMLDCSAVANIESISTENNRATVNGYITCDILYMSPDSDSPISGFCHVLPFNHGFDIPGIQENSVCDAKSDIEHLSYTISGSRDIELRAVISLTLKAVSPEKREFICQIDADTESVMPPLPAMLVYFIRPGDTLWEIAKRYRTTVEALMEANDVDPQNLQIGSPIYIFR